MNFNKNIIIMLPHQDDEIALLPYLDILKKNVNLKIIYLTRHKRNKVNMKRNVESKKVLKKLGVDDKAIIFLGTKKNIIDQFLCKNINNVTKYLLSNKNIITSNKNTTLLTTSYEGGHPDHDAAFLICMQIYQKMKYKKFLSFPLYNSERNFLPFQAFKNLRRYQNQVIEIQFSIKKSFLYFNLIFTYRSQLKTIFFLLPFFLYRCLIKRKFILILHNKTENIEDKPHKGKLLYEKRGWLPYSQFKKSCL
jgi:LmbE family N-acetylglucosaminyl deacetylase